jgi:hypothetical protein
LQPPTLVLKPTKHHSKNARRLQKRKGAKNIRTAERWITNGSAIGFESLALRLAVNGILRNEKKTIILGVAVASIAEECTVVFQDTPDMALKTGRTAEITTGVVAVVAEVVAPGASVVVEEIIWHLMVITTLLQQKLPRHPRLSLVMTTNSLLFPPVQQKSRMLQGLLLSLIPHLLVMSLPRPTSHRQCCHH